MLNFELAHALEEQYICRKYPHSSNRPVGAKPVCNFNF